MNDDYDDDYYDDSQDNYYEETHLENPYYLGEEDQDEYWVYHHHRKELGYPDDDWETDDADTEGSYRYYNSPDRDYDINGNPVDPLIQERLNYYRQHRSEFDQSRYIESTHLSAWDNFLIGLKVIGYLLLMASPIALLILGIWLISF